jgi:Family of unknown function (DUF6283)
MSEWILKQPKQCRNCPWRKESDITTIPNYSEEQHEALASTIADSEGEDNPLAPIEMMACHNSTGTGEDIPCVGWMCNQLDRNNIGLRLMMLGCDNAGQLETLGQQFATLSDTLPRNRSKKNK